MTKDDSHDRPEVTDRMLVQLMGSYLDLMLGDLRAQYSRMVREVERLEELGGAVGQIKRQLADIGKEVISSDGEKREPARKR
jgi:hypothetical protein